MAKRTISECFYRIRNGANIQQGKLNGGLPITRIETIANDRFNRDRMGFAGISDAGKYSDYVLEDGDILVSHINSLQYLGRAVLYRKQGNETIIHGMNLLGLKAERTIIDPAFACYCFRSRHFRKQILRIAKKSVNQASFSISDLGKIIIDVPDLQSQAGIVIETRQRQLRAFDTLIKARFVEMFGDPIVRLERGETIQLDRIADKITVGFVGEASNDYSEDGIPYLRTQNVRVNRIDLDGLIYVNESFHNHNKKSIIHPGDVVVSRVGANRGMAAVIPESLPEANIANCLIVGQTKSVNPYYLAFYLNMSFGKRPQFGASVGSAQGVINTAILKKWEVFVPNMQQQSEFNDFARQVDKSKVVVQKALDEAQLLFDSLMQKYFG